MDHLKNLKEEFENFTFLMKNMVNIIINFTEKKNLEKEIIYLSNLC